MDTDHVAPIILDGESLTIEKVVAVARYDAPVKLSEACYEDIDRARAMVERILREDRQVYGISTGFGEFSKITISSDTTKTARTKIMGTCTSEVVPIIKSPQMRAAALSAPPSTSQPRSERGNHSFNRGCSLSILFCMRELLEK